MRGLELTRPLVVIDIETTGLNKQEDRIVDICMVKIFPDGNEEKLNSIINPERPIPSESTSIHGIKDEDVLGKPTFKEFSKEMINFMEGCDLCGFNFENFDLQVIESELGRVGISWSRQEKHIVDVQKIYHKLEPRNLSAAYLKYCGKKLDGFHRAENDVMATIEVLQAQLERYNELPKDVPSLNEFGSPKDPSWIDDEGKIAWNNDRAVINFGTHKGKTLENLARTNQDYLRWILSKDFSSKVKHIITEALGGKFPQSTNSLS